MLPHQKKQAFTLIELSIVLVIIGLIVGGVLVGTTLINSSRITATISQLEEYKMAATIFKMRTGYKPGDIRDPDATRLGLHSRQSCLAGFGNGDDLLQGVNNINGGCGGAGTASASALNGESLLFWQDLARSNLIKDSTQNLTWNNGGWDIYMACPTIERCFPRTKLGNENYFTVWSGGYKVFLNVNSDRKNYYSIIKLTKLPSGYSSVNVGLKVIEAFSIDSKLDDGLPQSGSVLALYAPGYSPSETPRWSGVSGNRCCNGATDYNAPVTTATAYATGNCYDNNGVAGRQQYSTRLNSEGINCALSFRE